MGWDAVAAKFDRLAARLEPERRNQICDAVSELDELRVDELTRLLAIPAGTEGGPA
jgi:hypothetical protein